jgi:SH3-like domain-containing protein
MKTMVKNMAKQNNLIPLYGALALTLFGAASAAGQIQRQPPYWASIQEPEARMRTGPSTEFPVTWVYKRQNLPVKVIAVHSVWRKVQDPDGEQGWLHVRLLSPKRTAIVIGKDVATLRDAPATNAHISWRVEPGVVGMIEECEKGYCRFENKGRFGYIETAHIWGDEAP